VGQNAREHIVVGLGEVLWDLLPEGRQLGGAPANFAYHAAALGACGIVASSVGNDSGGRDIQDRLRSLDLDTSAVAVDDEHPTGTVSVQLDAGGKPSYIIHENVAWDFIPDGAALRALAARTEAVCFGTLAQRNDVSRRTIRRFLEVVPKTCLRIFDINLRQRFFSREVVESSLAHSDVLKLNDEELPVVAEMLGVTGDQDGILRELVRRYSLRLAALTRGPRGSVLQAADGRSVLPGQPVTVADTVGAGDAFTAVLAVGLLNGMSLTDLHRSAERLAGYVCTQAGATPVIPQEVRQAFLNY
jgi:fructokinase